MSNRLIIFKIDSSLGLRENTCDAHHVAHALHNSDGCGGQARARGDGVDGSGGGGEEGGEGCGVDGGVELVAAYEWQH